MLEIIMYCMCQVLETVIGVLCLIIALLNIWEIPLTQ